jgi:hypothetical protein
LWKLCVYLSENDCHQGGKDEFTVLKSFLSLLRHEPHALPWPRPTHDEDSILPQVAVILERIHSEFYGHPNSKNNVAHIVRKIYPEFRTYPPWSALRFLPFGCLIIQ